MAKHMIDKSLKKFNRKTGSSIRFGVLILTISSLFLSLSSCTIMKWFVGEAVSQVKSDPGKATKNNANLETYIGKTKNQEGEQNVKGPEKSHLNANKTTLGGEGPILTSGLDQFIRIFNIKSEVTFVNLQSDHKEREMDWSNLIIHYFCLGVISLIVVIFIIAIIRFKKIKVHRNV